MPVPDLRTQSLFLAFFPPGNMAFAKTARGSTMTETATLASALQQPSACLPLIESWEENNQCKFPYHNCKSSGESVRRPNTVSSLWFRPAYCYEKTQRSLQLRMSQLTLQPNLIVTAPCAGATRSCPPVFTCAFACTVHTPRDNGFLSVGIHLSSSVVSNSAGPDDNLAALKTSIAGCYAHSHESGGFFSF